MGRKLSPGESMMVAIKKVDVQPIMNEVHRHPFLWVCAFIAIFFVLGNLFEILWMLLRDLRRFAWKILRYPRRFVKHRIVDPMRKKYSKRYGKKKRNDRTLFKK
jgi:hypothetical protein